MDIENKITIAIDGYSSCGKSTLAKDLAKHFQFSYIDSGAMYRCVTLFCLNNNIIDNEIINIEKLKKEISDLKISFKYDNESKSNTTYLNGDNVEEKIRTIEVSNYVSQISELFFVRKVLVNLQKKMGEHTSVVMDGRDIGTVVFPNADIKIFMTADEDIRAQRRFDELQYKDNAPSMVEIKENIKKRDYIDSHRKISPLKKADDAIILDNSTLTTVAQFNLAVELINNRLSK